MKYLIFAAILAVSLSASAGESLSGQDCSTLKIKKRTKAWLCGEAFVCTNDICGRPQDLDFDEQFDVVLRDKRGKKLDAKKLSYERRRFCFDGYNDGDYQIAFVLYEKGVPQPARVFPTKYKHDRDKANDTIYMIEANCP